MIQKLKHECGYQFTSKLEGMFTDMRMSKDTMEQFKKQRLLGGGGIKELNVNVLTTGFWPSQSVTPCNLPPEISSCCEIFKEFYLNMHAGRRLTWQTNQGTADLLGNFAMKRHELNVSTYQMCILMLFNDADVLDFQAIKAGTSIQPDHELRRHLISLCTPKFRILQKSSKGKDISAQDKFTFNSNFKCQLHRVRILLVAQKEILGGTTAVPATVDEDRRHLIEAAIVRIMKARKSLQHNALIAEVSKQLSNRFVPNPQQIKRRIESLIEREYVERSRADRRVYNYLA
jgi:cullin 3